MVSFILRAIGVLSLAISAGILAWDVIQWQSLGQFQFSALGEIWYQLDPSSLTLLQSVTQRYLVPEIWDYALQPVMLTSGTLVALLLALLLIVFGEAARKP